MKPFTVLSLLFLSLWQLITGFQLDSLVLDTIDQTKNALEDEWNAATERVTFSGATGKSPPKNKFDVATMQVEAGIREASQFYRGISPTVAKSMIQKACNAKSYSIARLMFGHFIYNNVKAKSTSSRGKREATTVSAVKTSIKVIKRLLGQAFDKMQALDGGVTLIFAIDTTGSMYNDINSAKKIARYIIDNVTSSGETTMEVDYILAPFNDPLDSGRLPDNAHNNPRYFETTEKDDFLVQLDNLPVIAGGDCDEMLFHGIDDALTMSPRAKSPVFVFTDAGVKRNGLNVSLIIDAVGYQEMPIYFFQSSSTGCISKDDKKLYEEIAVGTGGQAMFFDYSSFLDTLGGYTKRSITGGSEVPVLPETSSASASRKEYSIVADDNMESLNIAATLYDGNADVRLYRPDGSIHDVKTDTGKGSLYMIDDPVPGKWKLTTSSDDYYVTGKTSAKDDISFRCVFPFTSKLGRKTLNITTGNPVIGVKTNMTCEIQAYKKIQAATLKIQIVGKDLRSVFSTMDLEQVDLKGRMFQAEMTPPSSEFMLILEGKTQKGCRFKRLSSSVFKPTKAFMYPYASQNYYIASKTKSNTISFAVTNYGSSEWFDVKVIEAKKFAVWHHNKIFAIKGRTALFRVSIKAPSDAVADRMHHLDVSIVGRVSGSKASHIVPLLIE